METFLLIIVGLLILFPVGAVIFLIFNAGNGYSNGRLAGKAGRNLGKAIGGRGSRRFR